MLIESDHNSCCNLEPQVCFIVLETFSIVGEIVSFSQSSIRSDLMRAVHVRLIMKVLPTYGGLIVDNLLTVGEGGLHAVGE